MRIALDHIDEIITTIRESETDKVAMETLQERFKLSERQAQAILDMRLRRLTGLERDKIENEYNELLGYISELEEILADDEVLLQLVRDELTDIKERFGDERRTEIQLGGLDDLEDEDLILKNKSSSHSIITILNVYQFQRIVHNTVADAAFKV